jgi:hypothetical protein
MTPKEKAKELFDKYTKFQNGYGYEYKAKQCALQAVELALEFVGGELDVAFDKTLFLVEVKHELIEMKNEWSKPTPPPPPPLDRLIKEGLNPPKPKLK